MTTTTKLAELTGAYVLDTAHTRIGFVVRQAMVTKVRGHFDEFESGTHLDGDDPSKSSAQLTIKALSIQTRNGLRDEHLRSHFLDIANHPTITFTSTGVEQVNETCFKVTGDLTTRRGQAGHRGLRADVCRERPFGQLRVDFEGKATINRKDWGVSWNALVEGGGVFVSEKVRREFDIAAIRQS